MLGVLVECHLGGFPRSGLQGRLDIESYYRFMYTKRYDQELCTAFHLPHSRKLVSKLKWHHNLKAGKPLTEVFHHDVEVEEPSALAFPNFHELLGKDNFNGNAWLAQDYCNVSDVEPLQPLDICEDANAAEGSNV